VSSTSSRNRLNRGSRAAFEARATTELLATTQPDTPSPILMRSEPRSPACGNSEACRTSSPAGRSIRYARQASQDVARAASAITSPSISSTERFELTMALMR